MFLFLHTDDFQRDYKEMRARRAVRRLRPKAVADDHSHLATDEIGRQIGQPIEIIVRIALLDRHVPALDEAGSLQAFAQRSQKMRERQRGRTPEEPDGGCRRLLRAGRAATRRRRRQKG